MMMAHDSSPTPPSRLDDESVNALRLALRAFLHNAEEPSGLRPALQRIATEARERAILPEHLLVELKEVWGALPEVRSMTDVRQQVNLLQRVVTMCITEYYSS